jgi:hypothetical protein
MLNYVKLGNSKLFKPNLTILGYTKLYLAKLGWTRWNLAKVGYLG